MNRYLVALVTLIGLATSASAWNNKGHMTVARVAWNELSPGERAKVIEILKSHPHFNEFLKTQRPAAMSEDEWVFLRAATWADWVRSGPPERRKYSVPSRHFINLAFVVKGNDIKPPTLNEENVVNGITKQKEQAMMTGDRVERAVAVTWLFHLAGDIHQPLHTVARFSNDFPHGDRGGNLAMVRIRGGGVVQLHHYWDGLLGTSTSRSSILKTVNEINSLVAENKESIGADLTAHTSPEEWAKESFDLAVEFGYEKGNLTPANVDDHPESSAIPTTREEYADNAGETARIQAYKGGKRLAQLIREVLAAN